MAPPRRCPAATPMTLAVRRFKSRPERSVALHVARDPKPAPPRYPSGCARATAKAGQ